MCIFAKKNVLSATSSADDTKCGEICHRFSGSL